MQRMRTNKRKKMARLLECSLAALPTSGNTIDSIVSSVTFLGSASGVAVILTTEGCSVTVSPAVSESSDTSATSPATMGGSPGEQSTQDSNKRKIWTFMSIFLLNIFMRNVFTRWIFLVVRSEMGRVEASLKYLCVVTNYTG